MITTDTVTLETKVCPTCGITYAVPEVFIRQRRDSGGDWHCPNGHTLHFCESSVDKLKAQLAAQESETRAAKLREQLERDQKQAAERQLSEERSKMVRLKKRVSAGTCPCCKRTVSQLARHMKSKHPDFPEK